MTDVIRLPVTCADAIAQRMEELEALTSQLQRENKDLQAQKDAWQERCKSLVDRITELHCAIWPAFDDIRGQLDRHAQQITGLNLRVGI